MEVNYRKENSIRINTSKNKGTKEKKLDVTFYIDLNSLSRPNKVWSATTRVDPANVDLPPPVFLRRF